MIDVNERLNGGCNENQVFPMPFLRKKTSLLIQRLVLDASSSFGGKLLLMRISLVRFRYAT